MPTWRVNVRVVCAQVKAIFGSNSAMRRRELDGEITDGEGAAFLKPTLDTLFTRPRITDLSRIAENVIYVCVDPNGGATLTGGPGSDTAIVSFAVSSGMFVVSGRGMCCCGKVSGWFLFLFLLLRLLFAWLGDIHRTHQCDKRENALVDPRAQVDWRAVAVNQRRERRREIQFQERQ